MTLSEAFAWFRKNILSPPVLFVVVVVGLILIGFGFRVFLGGIFRKIRGLPDPEIKSLEPIAPIDPDRVDGAGNVILPGKIDDRGWVQPQVYPVPPPDILSDENVVTVTTPDGPLDIELPRGVTIEEVKEVVVIKPGTATVTVHNREEIPEETLDTLLDKYKDVL